MENLLIQAIQSLCPNSEFTIQNNDYSTIEWHILEGEAPTKAEVDAAMKTVQTSIKAEEATKAASRAALLERLGITADEAKLLLS